MHRVHNKGSKNIAPVIIRGNRMLPTRGTADQSRGGCVAVRGFHSQTGVSKLKLATHNISLATKFKIFTNLINKKKINKHVD